MLGRVLAQVAPLMLGFGLMLLATGTFNTFAGVRGGLEEFPRTVIGAMMSAFYVGTIIGAWLCGRIINRVGHIRAFSAFAALSAAVVLLHPFMLEPLPWVLLRGVLGFCSAGLYICTESWLNERVTTETRGSVLSLHAMVSFLGFGGGQLMLTVGDPATTDLFMIAALLFAIGVLPVALTRASNPETSESTGFGPVQLFRAAPVACMSCVAAGLSISSLFGMGPPFGQDLDFSVGQISALMTALILSGLLLQFPVGWLSDRRDRRAVIGGVALAGGVTALAIAAFVGSRLAGGAFLWDQHGLTLLALAVLFGALVATLYPLGVAYANDYLSPDERVQAAGGLVLAYGLGSVGGPLLAAGVMELAGPIGLFLYNGGVGLALFAFALYRATRRTWAGTQEKEPFQLMPEATGTPGGWDYDPRWEETDGGESTVDPGAGSETGENGTGTPPGGGRA